MTTQEELEKTEKKLAEQIIISDWIFQQFNNSTSLMEDLEQRVRELKYKLKQESENPEKNPFDDDGEPEDIPF